MVAHRDYETPVLYPEGHGIMLHEYLFTDYPNDFRVDLQVGDVTYLATTDVNPLVSYSPDRCLLVTRWCLITHYFSLEAARIGTRYVYVEGGHEMLDHSGSSLS